ncbi:hypothetical protein FJ950_17860 [Mesorhizobium sp. B2-3-14]|uniref:hypothetical protein n=1 Tax=Mesorhizobium sp. B2-3-14 TaxID=2589950 RepID=UPI00112CA7EB|nr:hypothetical protein [Mesorhizobium sp. B2-3-14]TPL84060.1 hypothetical protein FJ950_17860 [Mesorhizobium sp. B2-3-14]
MAINGFDDIAHALGMNEYEAPEVQVYQEGSDETPVGRKVVYRVNDVEVSGEQYLKSTGTWEEYQEWLKSAEKGHTPVELGKLGTVAHDATKAFFEVHEHEPNPEQWHGLDSIIGAYERMAEGQAAEKFFISSLPTGMGKTTVAIESTKALLADPEFDRVSVVYFLSRRDQIVDAVKRMDLQPGAFAVLTADDDVNKLGRLDAYEKPDVKNARVLFTTQRRLEDYANSGKSFADMKAFHYHGEVRQVRVWDEAILPSLTLKADQFLLAGLSSGLRRLSSDLAYEILGFAHSLKDHVGERITMPDIERYTTGMELVDFKGLFQTEEQRATAHALYSLSGHVVNVRRDGNNNITLGYNELLPADLAPMLVLDASGDLRQTYDFWERYRQTLERLPSPKKSYSGLTIRHRNTAAGKHLFSSRVKDNKQAQRVADDVAQMIAETPSGERVLVITHKWETYRNRATGEDRPKDNTLPALVERRLNPSRLPLVEYLHYGRHTATNEYRDFKHVILAGLLQYDDASYEADGRGAKKADVMDAFPAEELQKMRIGEISHHIFQAAGRGSIRKTINGGCPEGCHLYVVFSTNGKGGFPQGQLSVIFPNADILDWKPDGPVEVRLSGNVRRAFEFIVSKIHAYGAVKTTEVMEYLKMTGGNFKNRVIDHRDFMPALAAKGIILIRGKPGVFRMA